MHVADIWSNNLLPSLADYIVIGVYLIIMFLLAGNIKNRKIDQNPVYKFYTWGLFAHVAGAIAMGLIYTLYYKDGGDTTAYYRSSEAMVNLLFQNPRDYFRLLFGNETREVYSAFNQQTGFPGYFGKTSSFMVVRIASITTLLSFKYFFT